MRFSDQQQASHILKSKTHDSEILSPKIKNPESYGTLLNSITPVPSQSVSVKFNNHKFLIHLDSGATVSFITVSTILKLGVQLKPNGQLAMLADEKTRMQSLGEIDILITTNDTIVLRLRALVVEHLKVDCYAGTTFHVDNHVKADITTGFVSLHGGSL